MTIIQCNVKVAGTTNFLSGFIRVNIESDFSDDTGFIWVPVATDYNLVSGVVSFDLEPSDIAKVSYVFEIWQNIPDTIDGLGVHTINPPKRLKSFKAIIPSSATPINLKDLSTQTGIRYDSQDASLLTLSRYLYSNDTFWSALSSRVWQNKGIWDITLFYKRGDVVLYNGSGYQYMAQVVTSTNLPTDTNYWQLLVSKGDTGTGTTGNNAAYGVSWVSATDAPSRDSLYTKIETLATTTQLASKASLTGAVLTSATANTNPTITDNTTTIATTAFVQSLIAAVKKASIPVGSVTAWFTNSPPQYWTFLDGRAISRATYSDLFAIWGTTFGVGDGTTTFNLPDCRGRTLVSRDTTATNGAAGVLTSYMLGDRAGTENVILTASQLPAHTHAVNITASGNITAGYGLTASAAFINQAMVTGYAPTTATTSTGDGTAHPNLQPSIITNYIVYTGV